jgi:hypothetical protein
MDATTTKHGQSMVFQEHNNKEKQHEIRILRWSDPRGIGPSLVHILIRFFDDRESSQR